MKIPFSIDLGGRTAVITGAGGIICGEFAKALATQAKTLWLSVATALIKRA